MSPSRVLLAFSLILAGALVAPAPAHAGGGYGPPGAPACTAATEGRTEIEVLSAEVNPALTQFMSINIAPGTTGERTETLTVMRNVTTSIGVTTEFSAEAGFKLFAKVSVKTGISVQLSVSSTSTETTSMKWTFTQPGYYGLYKGTRAVTGTFKHWRCQINSFGRYNWRSTPYPVPGPPVDINEVALPYTTFANIEAGTVTCAEAVPTGSLRAQARLQLGC